MLVAKAMVKVVLATQRDVPKLLLHHSAPQCTCWCHCHVLKSGLFTLQSEGGVGAWHALPALQKGSCKYSLSLSIGVFSSCRVYSFLPGVNRTMGSPSMAQHPGSSPTKTSSSSLFHNPHGWGISDRRDLNLSTGSVSWQQQAGNSEALTPSLWTQIQLSCIS